MSEESFSLEHSSLFRFNEDSKEITCVNDSVPIIIIHEDIYEPK